MKKYILVCLMVILGVSVNAQQQKALNSYVSYATFNVPGTESSPYVETYITLDKNSLVYVKGANGQFNATVNVTILFKQGESIKNFGKYSVASPYVSDTTNVSGFFMDMQRYSLDNGTYIMEITLEDANHKSSHPFYAEDEVLVDFPEKLCMSSIIGLESYSKAETEGTMTKNGFNLIPMMVPFYPESMNKLSFYAEIYNAKKQLGDDKYLLNTYISTFETGVVLNNFFFTKRMTAKDIDVIINSIDITNLPSGNYYLMLEARDRNNEVIGMNRMFFQRSNPYYQVDNTLMASINPDAVFTGKINNLDTIREYIRTLAPISTLVEKDYGEELVKTDDIITMQQFFYTFWSSRNKLEPERAWQDYYTQVKRVNASFTTLTTKGYASDRGIVFLKYGAPDRIVQSYNEPGAFPYEIWHYYVLGTTQRNKKFVFMTRDLATNDFKLIHSDAIGELSNFRWTTEIYQRTYGTYFDYGVDGAADPNSYGDRAKDYYDNPR